MLCLVSASNIDPFWPHRLLGGGNFLYRLSSARTRFKKYCTPETLVSQQNFIPIHTEYSNIAVLRMLPKEMKGATPPPLFDFYEKPSLLTLLLLSHKNLVPFSY